MRFHTPLTIRMWQPQYGERYNHQRRYCAANPWCVADIFSAGSSQIILVLCTHSDVPSYGSRYRED